MDRLNFPLLHAGDGVVSVLLTEPERASDAEFMEYRAQLGLAPTPEVDRIGWLAEDAPNRALDVRSLQDTDARFDRLWDATRRQFSSTNLRSAEVIHWYCFASKHHSKTLIGGFDGEQLRGFVITQRITVGKFAVLRVRDLWTDFADPIAIDALSVGALAEARRAGCDLLYVPPLDSRISSRLRRLGAWQGPAGAPTARVRAPGGILGKLRPPHLYGSEGLGDTGL
jgi:hypothetical protein